MDKVFQNSAEDIGELQSESLVTKDGRKPLSFVKHKIRRQPIDLPVVNMLYVRIGITRKTLVTAIELKICQLNAQFFAQLARQCLFGRLSGLDMAAEEIPAICKRDLRFVIAQVNDQPAGAIK